MGSRTSNAVTRAAVAGIAAAALAPSALVGQTHPDEPLAGVAEAAGLDDLASPTSQRHTRRIVRVFDFEEPSNPDPVPRDWFRAQETPGRPRPGFPLYNEAEFDRTGGRGGGSCVVLPVRGGSNSLRLMAGAIPVLPLGDYALAAWVRTEGLTHARAFVAARLLDEQGRPLPGTEVRTEPLTTGGKWQPVSLRLVGRHADAAYLQIDCELLQPDQFRPAGLLGGQRVVLEDVAARAWVDDVVVYQLPRIHITTGEPGNAVSGNAPPELRITVRDLVGEGLRATVTVRDVDGRTVARESSLMQPDGEPWRWRPDLTQFGWYTADLDVTATGGAGAAALGGTKIGATRMQFAWLAPNEGGEDGGGDAGRFGLIADRIAEEHLPLLPSLLDRSESSFVHVWAWQPEDDPSRYGEATSRRRPWIDALAGGGEVTMVITHAPDELSERHRADGSDPLALAQLGESDWGAYMNPLLELYGQRIRRWSVAGDLGGLSGGAQPLWRRDLRQDLLAFDSVIRRLTPGPAVGLGWRADWGLPAELIAARTEPVEAFVPSQPPTPGSPVLDAVRVTYPSWLPPGSVPLLAEQLGETRGSAAVSSLSAGSGSSGGSPGPESQPDLPELTLVLDLPPPDAATPRGRVIETVRRTVEFWRAFGDDGVSRVALNHPWSVSADDSGAGELHANPELAVWPTLSRQLAGRRILGSLDLTPGVQCYFLAERDATGALGRGALVAWNESAERADAALRFFTGDDPLFVVDAFGNRTLLSSSDDAGGERAQRIAVTETPIFIEGVHSYIASFMSTFRIDEPFVEAVSALHDRELILHNPWPTPLEVVYQIRPPRQGEPGEWSVSPRGTQRLSIRAGGVERVPFSFRFGPAEMAGPQEMQVVIRLRSDREYPPLVLTVPLEIGLSDLELAPDFILTPTPAGPDVAVVAMLTNTGARPRTLRMVVRAPGQPSQTVQISNLAPGDTTRRQFFFPGAAAELSGRSVTIKLEDNDAPIYLRKSVQIP